MKALTLVEYNRLVYGDASDPKPGAGEVLIRVKACGICGSDVHGLDGSTGRRRPPIIMGHEASGVIAALGSGVSNWYVGDRVTFDSTIYCGTCEYRQRGQVNLCDHRRVLGVSCEDYRCHGAFADFVVVPQRILYRLPDAVTFEQAAMIEALSVAVHAVHRAETGHRLASGASDTACGPQAPPLVGARGSAVVVGAGMIGLLVIQALRAAGWTQIIAVDLDRGRLQTAKLLGAHEILDAGVGNVAQEAVRLTGGRGADAVLEVVGAAPTVQTALACVRKGGTVVLVGNLAQGSAVPPASRGDPGVERPRGLRVGGRIPRMPGADRTWRRQRGCLGQRRRAALRRRAVVRATAEEGSGTDEGRADDGLIGNKERRHARSALRSHRQGRHCHRHQPRAGPILRPGAGTSRAPTWSSPAATRRRWRRSQAKSRPSAAAPLPRRARRARSRQHPGAADRGAVAHYGKIDILVNNAGCNVRKPALDVTWDDWNLVLDTNLRGTFFVAQAVARAHDRRRNTAASSTSAPSPASPATPASGPTAPAAAASSSSP